MRLNKPRRRWRDRETGAEMCGVLEIESTTVGNKDK